LLIDLLGVVFALWILNLVRTQRLHLGYALLWLTAVGATMILITVTPLRDLVTRAVGAVFPASALALLAFAFIFFVLILFSVQVSALSRRQNQLVKELARRTMRDGEPGDD
jgi:hypothetical protein